MGVLQNPERATMGLVLSTWVGSIYSVGTTQGGRARVHTPTFEPTVIQRVTKEMALVMVCLRHYGTQRICSVVSPMMQAAEHRDHRGGVQRGQALAVKGFVDAAIQINSDWRPPADLLRIRDGEEPVAIQREHAAGEARNRTTIQVQRYEQQRVLDQREEVRRHEEAVAAAAAAATIAAAVAAEEAAAEASAAAAASRAAVLLWQMKRRLPLQQRGWGRSGQGGEQDFHWK